MKVWGEPCRRNPSRQDSASASAKPNFYQVGVSVTADLALRRLFSPSSVLSFEGQPRRPPEVSRGPAAPCEALKENQYLCVISRVLLNKTNVPEDVGFPGSCSWSPLASDFCSPVSSRSPSQKLQ